MSETPTPTLGTPRARGKEIARTWRKRRSRARRWLRRSGDVALVALAVFAIGFGLSRAHSGGSSSTTTATAAPGSFDARYPPTSDVKVTGCNYWKSLYAGGVTVSVINHTPTPWTYYVDVRWKNGKQKFSEVVLHSKRVAGFRTLVMGGFGLAPNHTAPRQLTCTIMSVRRVGV